MKTESQECFRHENKRKGPTGISRSRWEQRIREDVMPKEDWKEMRGN
jgi:hypothetical protein